MDFYAETQEEALAMITKGYLNIKKWVAKHDGYDDGESPVSHVFCHVFDVNIKDYEKTPNNGCAYIKGVVNLDAGRFELSTKRFNIIASLSSYLDNTDTPFKSFTLTYKQGYAVTLEAEVEYGKRD